MEPLFCTWIKNNIPNWDEVSCFLDSAAVSILVVILVELTNTETAVVTLSRAILNFQKATNQGGVVVGALFLMN